MMTSRLQRRHGFICAARVTCAKDALARVIAPIKPQSVQNKTLNPQPVPRHVLVGVSVADDFGDVVDALGHVGGF